MKNYQVTWTININAATPQKAAELALQMQRDPYSGATWFDVTDPTAPMTITIDLSEEAA